MPDTYNYPAEIERDEDGRFVITFPDFGWGGTDGATRDEALAEANDLLRELIVATIREGEMLPEPSGAGRRRSLVVPPVQIALKAALYEAWREAGISQRHLARATLVWPRARCDACSILTTAPRRQRWTAPCSGSGSASR